MSCCKTDVSEIVSISGTTVTVQYLDRRVSPPVLMTQGEYDALVKVACPETKTDWEDVCIQPIGNTNAALIENGMRLVTSTISYDAAGDPTVEIENVSIYQADGTDVTTTYEEVDCPQPIIVETDSCVAPPVVP